MFMQNKIYFVYVLESLGDKSWYIGQTSDLKNRLAKHNKKSVFSTKNKAPYKLIYFEGYLHRADAMRREKYLKSGAGRIKLKQRLTDYLLKRNGL
jgi:putative endonuclease